MITYFFDQDLIERFQKLETCYDMDPESISDKMIELLGEKFGDQLPQSVKVFPDVMILTMDV